MAKNTETRISDEKKFKAYFKKSKDESIVKSFFIGIREYGLYIFPLIIVYLLLYFALLTDTANGHEWLYVILAFVILAVDGAAFYLVRLIRKQLFVKYSEKKVPMFKGNVWHCPFCDSKNTTKSPCKTCGIFPELYRSDADVPVDDKVGRKRKERKEFNEYTPQFK